MVYIDSTTLFSAFVTVSSVAVEVEFGTSSKGKQTVIYRSFEYVKERDNQNGSTAWRCQKHQSMQCKARLCNVASTLGRKAVGEMKSKMSEMNATSSTTQAAVIATLNNDVLMALPKQKTLARTLQRAPQKATTASGGIPLPTIPSDVRFDIPTAFKDMVLFDSDPADERLIMLGCDELLDGLARANLWLTSR